MSVEFREWRGMRMTFMAGMAEPVWWVAETACQIGNVPRAARRLGVRVSKLRAVLQFVQNHARQIEFERTCALDAGIELPVVPDPLPALVFPAEELRWRRPPIPVSMAPECDGQRRWRNRRRDFEPGRDSR